RRSSGASGGGIRSERWREWSVEMFPQRCVGKLQGIRPRQADFHWDAFLGSFSSVPAPLRRPTIVQHDSRR
ncbi:unnamed protein product, partial [Gadus morhua 'NCC']